MSLSGLVGLGLGFALGYIDPGLLPSEGLGRRSWGKGGSLLEGPLMLAVSPILASPTGAAPGISEIIAILFLFAIFSASFTIRSGRAFRVARSSRGCTGSLSTFFT